MSDRLYYTDSYLAAFESPVFAIDDVDGRPAVRLGKAASGRPRADGCTTRERLAAWRSWMSWRRTTACSRAGWCPRLRCGRCRSRCDRLGRGATTMQQHSGQHLLSQHFFRRFGWETVSVHFGAEESTLDLDTPDVSPAQLAEIEVWPTAGLSCAAIRRLFVDETGLAAVPLRRPPKVTGVIRIVEIEAFDYSACGGTHVAHDGGDRADQTGASGAPPQPDARHLSLRAACLSRLRPQA